MNTKLRLAVTALALVASTSALAHGGNNYNRGGTTYVQHNNYNRGGYNQNRGYNNYNRGGNWNGNGWGYAGAAIAGALIGGAIANSYAQPAPQPYYNPYAPVAPIYSYPPPGVYVQPVAPSWHWEQRYDAACNCMRNIQVLD